MLIKSSPITIVIPTLADRELLVRCLSVLQAELKRRERGDEIICVDDTGTGRLAAWLSVEAPDVLCVTNPRNLGFGGALLRGVQAASHELVFAMNPDVLPRAGCFEPLIETLTSQPDVRAVAPYVLLNGQQDTAESVPTLVLEEGLPRVVRKVLAVLPGERCAEFPRGIPVAFALGGACLIRRDEFLRQPFDARFEPFYWEDVDLGQSAWDGGQRVLVDPRAVVEHHHRGTIASHVPEPLVRAAIEKNRLLFAWKHLRGPERVLHFQALAARIIEHGLGEDREELVWLALALEDPALGALAGAGEQLH